MAKFTRKRLAKNNVTKVLGDGWCACETNGRPYAVPKFYDAFHYNTALCTVADGDYVPVQGGNDLKVRDVSMWPTAWKVKLDLADLYVDTNDNFVHPLRGFKIAKLIEATHFPFHNKDYVRVILAYRDNYGDIYVNNPKPNVAIFVDTWSHHDERAHAPQYRTPNNAFNVPSYCSKACDGPKSLPAYYCIDFPSNRVGKNFIMLPFGFDHEAFVEEKTYDIDKKAAEWHDIIQKFLDGEEGTGTEETNADEPGDVLSIVDNTSTAVDVFVEFQQKLAAEYREKFLCPENVDRVASCEAYLTETLDKNGVLLYEVANSDRLEPNTLMYYETLNGVCYRVRRYNYSRQHLQQLETDIGILVASFGTLPS